MEPHSDSSASRGASSSSSRKYTIRSNFGHARQPRSRKNRPCDTCRKRKTACVIPNKPPCLFCKSRGLVCQSSPVDAANPRVPAASDASPPFEDVDLQSPSGSEQRGDDLTPGSVVPDASEDGDTLSSIGVSPLAIHDRPVHALEDLGDRTSHCLGLSAEQDTYFLDTFRSIILDEKNEVDAKMIQVHNGGLLPHQHPLHFLLLLNGFPEHTDRALEEASSAVEALVGPHGPALVRLYFKHVHPVYPVVSKVRFLRRYATDRTQLPTSLRGAVYAMACVFWRYDPSLPLPRPFEQHQLIAHAHSSLRRELEAPNLYKLQACMLLLHLTPPEIDSVETPSTWTLTAQATACAQMIGLHQDPTFWNIATWEKRLRKKLWWFTFATDCWSSICHGNPPHIGADTYDTAAPVLDDVQFDEDVPEDLHYLVDPDSRIFHVPDGYRFIEYINIARTMRNILDCGFQVKRNMSTPGSREQLAAIREKMKDWTSLIPHCLTVGSDTRHNCPLNLSYHAMQVLLFRSLMAPATKEAKATPGSNLQQYLSTALADFRSFTTFMGNISPEELRGFWGRHARSQLILCGNFLIYLFLLSSQPGDVQAAYQLIEKYHQALQRLGAANDSASLVLLRPAMLRIDSFFIQATELIKNGNPPADLITD